MIALPLACILLLLGLATAGVFIGRTPGAGVSSTPAAC
jgi:hypothetical protein